jgi:hypothetical protein
MRFKSRAEVLLLSFAALSPAAFLSVSPATAQQLAYAPEPQSTQALLPTPLPQATPRLDMTWSETRQPKTAAFSKLRSRLDQGDAYATLNALHFALSTLGDGQTYVWGRPKRQLKTMVTLNGSFRNEAGRVCRRITVTMALGRHIKRTESTACRADDKSWQLT